jgi:hypothetical protein
MRLLRAPFVGSILCAASVLAGGCASTKSPDASAVDAGQQAAGGGAGASSDAAAPGDGPVVGTFIVEMVPATGTTAAYTTMSGKVFDGPSPSTVAWDLIEDSGGCQLSKPRAPFCNPACGSGKLCVETNTCAGYPTAQNLGPVQVSGLGSGDFSMLPIANSYEPPGDLTLPFPPAAEAADVRVAITQGPFGAFTLQSKVVAPLVSSGAVTMETGKPVQLTWDPPGQADLARVEVKLDISHHGGTKGKIECDVADSGSLEIPESLITKLIDLGVAGFPTITLTRVTTGATAIAPGKVTLRVLSAVSREVLVTGFQSCDETHPCPTGQSCQQSLTCAP